jgi:ATP synthase protein I
MPEPTDDRARALNSLDEQLKAFEAQRAPKVSPLGGSQGMGEGYRLLAGLLGGLFGGIGLGWTFDHFAHTGHIGLVCGLLIGLVASIFGVVSQASRMSARAEARRGPVPPARSDEDQDD